MEKFGVGDKEVGGRMTRFIRDTRTAQKIKLEQVENNSESKKINPLQGLIMCQIMSG